MQALSRPCISLQPSRALHPLPGVPPSSSDSLPCPCPAQRARRSSGQALGLLGAGTLGELGGGPGLCFQSPRAPHSPCSPRSSETDLRIDPLPTARKTRCPSSAGFMGGRGRPPAAVALRTPGLMAKSIGVRLAWIRPGFATCQLVPSGKFLGPSEPQLSDL